MKTMLRKTTLPLAMLALTALVAPAMAQGGGNHEGETNAFARTPPANTHAFGTEHGGKVTAFGNGGKTTNASGDKAAATHNAHRMANSFGTGTDHNASPVGPSGSGR